MSWREEVGGSRFVNFKEENPFRGTFKGGRMVENKFGKCVELSFVDDSGEERIINTKSNRLLRQMKRIKDGTEVEIKRTGESFETFYEVTNVDIAGQQKAKEVKEIWDES